MASANAIPLFSLFCLILIISIVTVQAKHHHSSRHESRRLEAVNDGDSQGYCMKSEQKNLANGWSNTTMDIQYTKTVKIESSKEGHSKLKESTRNRRSSKSETPAEKKKRRKAARKAKKAKKQKKAENTSTAAPTTPKSQR